MRRRTLSSVAALSAATLLLESTLTRLLAVAQFYHFAFLVVSLALLGFGASGTLLSLSPRLRRTPLERLLAWAGLAFAASVALAYAAVNGLPFDSYSIAWDRRQILYFVLYYLALTLPFLCGGLAISMALAVSSGYSHVVYAANLLGSAAGVLLAPLVLGLAGVPGAVLVSALSGLLASLLWRAQLHSGLHRLALAALLGGLIALLVLAGFNLNDRGPLGMTISPYKGLAHARRFPGSTILFSRWSAISHITVVANAGTHMLPGLSYTAPILPPAQHGLASDADALQPITLVGPEGFEAGAYMPEAVAFHLRPAARVLVLEPAGGLGVLQALAGGARTVTAVVSDPLVPRATAHTNPLDIYASPAVNTVVQPPRVFLHRDRHRYDVLYLPLTDPYRPVTSGAYSLSESYLLTVEAFQDGLAHLAPGGIFVVTRWLQTPPSEGVRLIATLVEALQRQGVRDPAQALVAYRGIQTLTVLARPDGWSAAELAAVRSFTRALRYDLVWAPDIQPDEVNRFNRMPEPAHYQAVRALLAAPDRKAFYARYPFAIDPATDDHPFFFHFFRWGQTPQVLATLGRTWQPFGGSGYFVLFALLALVLLLSLGLIAAPLLLALPAAREARQGDGVEGLAEQKPQAPGRHTGAMRALIYFGLLGIAFMFVEIPLIQRWILPFGHPTYAFTAVVLALLLFSSLGSTLARRPWLARRTTPGAVGLMALLVALVAPLLTEALLGWPVPVRVVAAVASLAPLGFLMGLPFPLGLAWLEEESPGLIPWAWAVNGCASVTASVLAAILALSYGFTAVMVAGAAAYIGAWLAFGSRRI
jgi:hypothetical protein